MHCKTRENWPFSGLFFDFRVTLTSGGSDFCTARPCLKSGYRCYRALWPSCSCIQCSETALCCLWSLRLDLPVKFVQALGLIGQVLLCQKYCFRPERPFTGLRAPTSPKKLRKSLFGGLQKSPKFRRKCQKTTPKSQIWVFFDFFGYFRALLLQTPKETLSEIFLRCRRPEGAETGVNGRSGRKALCNKSTPEQGGRLHLAFSITVGAEIITELILERADPVTFKTFLLELIGFRLIPVICPARRANLQITGNDN